MNQKRKAWIIAIGTFISLTAILVFFTFFIQPKDTDNRLYTLGKILSVSIAILGPIFTFLNAIGIIRFEKHNGWLESPIRPITLEELKVKLGRPELLTEYVDRGMRKQVDLSTNHNLAISGLQGVGKTREIIEIMLSAAKNEIIDENHIFELTNLNLFEESIFIDLLSKQELTKTRITLFIDDFHSKCKDPDLEKLDQLIRTLGRGERLFIFTTARKDKISEKQIGWLIKDKYFNFIKLSELNESNIDEFLHNLPQFLEINMGRGVKELILKKTGGIPQLIQIGVKRLASLNIKKITLKNAQEEIKGSLKDAWEDDYHEIIKKQPAVKYIIKALTIFFSANVGPYTPLVLAYAKNIWLNDKKQKMKLHKDRILLNSLEKLSNYWLQYNDEIILPRDYMVEDQINSVSAQQELGVFLTHHKKFFANQIFQKFYKNSKVHSLALMSLGISVAQRIKSDAMVYFDYSRRFFPSAKIFYNLGVLLDDLGRKEEAEAAYRQAIQKDPEYAAAYNNLGVLLKDLGRKEDAEAAYRQAIQKGPEFAQAYYNLGVLLDNLGRKEEAEAAYRQAIQKGPEFAQAYYNLGVLLKDLGRKEEAEAAYRQAIQKDPEDAEAYSNLGVLLDNLGRKEEAEAAFRQAIQKDPEDAAAYNNLGVLLEDLGRKEEAEAAYRQAIQKDPENAKAYYNLGVLLDNLGRKEDAEAAYRQAIQKDPKLAQAYNNLGMLLRLREELTEAIYLFNKSAELLPRLSPFLNLAGIYRKLNNYQNMAVAIEEVLKYLKSDDWYNMACLETIKGNLDSAFEYLRKAVKVPEFDAKWAWQDPDFEWIRDDPRFTEIVGPNKN